MGKKKKTSRGKHAASIKPKTTNSVDERDQPEGIETTSIDIVAMDVDNVGSAEVDAPPLVEDGAFVPAFVDAPKKKPGNHKKFFKVLGFTLAIIFAVIGIAYGAGCFIFSGRFMPNTTIGGHDVSFKTVEECVALVDELRSGYTLAVSGQGLTLGLSASDVGLDVNSLDILNSALANMKPWSWPLELLHDHDVSDYLEASYNTSLVDKRIKKAVDTVNETAEPPTDATLIFDETMQCFKVAQSKLGTHLDLDSVKLVIKDALSSLKTDIEITPDELTQPLVEASHQGLVDACDSANDMLNTNLSLTLDGIQIAALDPATISQWIMILEDFTVVFNDEAFNTWTEEVIAGCNTIGSERTYTRPDGKVIMVSGGNYGWEVDGDALREQIKAGVNSGKKGELAIPVLQSGNGFSQLGSQDWGNRYCDIDLTEQYARFYDEDGTLIWEAPIVSGAINGKDDTPTGVYYINNKLSPTTLIGEKDPETGKPKYRSPVSFWMSFIGNWVGLHDATWQYSFGGTRYIDGYGSHGCINLSYSDAQNIYDIIQIGDVVITHW